MTATKDSHPIVDRARALISRLEALESIAEDHQEIAIRAKAVLEQLVVRVEGANPLLLSIRALDLISDHVNAVESALPALEGAETTSTVADLASAIEEVLYRLPDLLHIQRPEDVEPVRNAIQSVTGFAESQVKALGEQVNSLRNSTQELGTGIKTANQSHETNVSAINDKLTELTAAIQVQKEELQTALKSQASQFEAEQENRKTGFSALLTEITSAHEAAKTEMADKGEASVQEVHKKAEAVLEHIQKRKKEVEATAGAVGLTATISGFAKYADQQQKSADWWRWVAVGALLAVAALGVGTLIFVGETDLTLQRSLLKGSVGTALAFLAGYAGKQSGHHRREERRSRRLGLEVAAFDPYVANLDAPRQKSLKEFMALRVFGHLEDPDTEEDKWGEHQPSVQKVLEVLRPGSSE